MWQHHAIIMEQRWLNAHVLCESVAAASEDPGGTGPGSADVGLQHGGQRAAQDTAQDPQEQPCEFLTKVHFLKLL